MRTEHFPFFRRLTTLSLLCSLALSIAAGEGWPNWRGPNHNGSTSQGEYPAKFTADQLAWKVKLPGKGTSTPIVHDTMIYLTSPADDQDAVLAFDLDGKQKWLTKIGPEDAPKHRQLASSGNASPVTDGKAVFAYFKSGNFAALEFDGKIRWKINLVEQFGREQLFWDQGTSPVVTDQHVIMARMHGGESWIAGFDKATGELRWRELRNYETPIENNNGYTTPIPFNYRGKKALLVWGADHLTAHDAANGKLLWSCGGFNPEQTGYWPHIATPVIAGEIAVVPVGRDDRRQGRVHGIRLDGSGDVTQTHRAWQREDVGVFVASPAFYEGRVYLLRNRNEVVCLDPQDGQTLWTGTLEEHRTPYYASPLVANGVLYAAREDGKVFMARVGEKFELLGQTDLGERIIASPIAVAGRIFLRGDNHLFCIADK